MFIFALLALVETPSSEAHQGWSGGTVLLNLGAVSLLVFLNGFFVAAEFALVKVRGSQIDALLLEGRPGAKLVKKITEKLDSYLSACQLGITLASLALGWVGEPFMAQMLFPILTAMGVESEKLIHTISVIVGFSVITALHITLGEQAPKILAIQKPLPTTFWISPPLHLFCTIFNPAIWFLNHASNLLLKYVFRLEPVNSHEVAHSEEELRVILAESAKAEEVSALGKELLINALDLSELVVRDITTPRGEVVFLNTEDTFEVNLRLAMQSRHTRFPLCEGHLDHTIGLVHIKDLLTLVREPSPDLHTIRRDMFPVPEMMKLEKLLTFFLSKHAHLALVVDEYGGTVGVVTLDNVLEEIVGEIQDEFDADKPELRRVDESEFVVAGSLGLYELHDMVGLTLESEDVSTIGGFVTHAIGHLPKQGEFVDISGYRATVTKADNRRVLEVQFKKLGSGASSE